MALFRLITLSFFLRERLLLGARLNFLKNFFFRDLGLKIFSTSHECPKENFSLQYRYNIKHRSDENKVKYQLRDYKLLQYQILQIDIIRTVRQTVRRITK